ncbi:TetR/AcrR family transcriptional regulator [Shewanella surugensis]|uniref:TetR/AcrR family transcriptional regulator n=1 Tax=Shewanella surugensis TaxID=212020 RepID=A0ABT0L7J6_9GAMM|nr:TetR/AcrR family transcriptional regulator [Shewanella surugensis]MCL1123549.1 TetR/AcrR family transcriptional regulator [Shewanella surugensis]
MSPMCNGSSVGRPRTFDLEQALEKALDVFWRKGYEGTSLTDLTQAMGINKPSLYSAFGNKEQLFLKAIDLYEQRPCGYFLPALEQKTAYNVALFMLEGAAENLTNTEHPQGCIIVQSALACSESGTSVKEALINRRRENEEKLCQRFIRAREEGDLKEDTDPEVLAKYLVTVLQGMAVQATNGVSNKELHRVAQVVLSAFAKS